MSRRRGPLERSRSAGVIVDANLLLLFFVGAFDSNQIARFKRTCRFTEADHAVLEGFLAGRRKIVTTPHILTEVSNLAGQLAEPARTGVLRTLAEGLARLEELHVGTSELIADPSFTRFGITDAAVFHHARGRYAVLTEDATLSQYLHHHGIEVLNFNIIRYEMTEA